MLLERILEERRMKIVFSITDPNLSEDIQRFRKLLQLLPTYALPAVARRYYNNLSREHIQTFYDWREKITDMQAQGLQDINDGYYYPYLQPRTVNGVQTADDIFFRNCEPKLREFMDEISDLALRKQGFNRDTLQKTMKKKIN